MNYICPQDLWGGEVKKGEIFYPSSEKSYRTKRLYYLPKEIVETWEKYQKIEVGSYVVRNASGFYDPLILKVEDISPLVIAHIDYYGQKVYSNAVFFNIATEEDRKKFVSCYKIFDSFVVSEGVVNGIITVKELETFLQTLKKLGMTDEDYIDFVDFSISHKNLLRTLYVAKMQLELKELVF